jgi:hypothetical protein
MQNMLLNSNLGDHYKTIAAANGVNAMTVSRSVKAITKALLTIGNKWIRLPTAEELPAIKEGFFKVKFLINHENHSHKIRRLLSRKLLV